MAVEVPLHARDGSVRAVALVDEADAELVLAHTWSINSRGYAVRGIQLPSGRWTSLLLHRFVLGLEPGDPRIGEHRNRTPLDCQRANRRVGTHALNHQNRDPAGNRGSSSRYRGVTWAKARGQWRARVRLNDTLYHLGYFTDEDAAGAAAADFRAQHMPFSAEAA